MAAKKKDVEQAKSDNIYSFSTWSEFAQTPKEFIKDVVAGSTEVTVYAQSRTTGDEVVYKITDTSAEPAVFERKVRNYMIGQKK